MVDDLYNTDVLSLAANIEHVGRLEAPSGHARKVSKLCGSWVEVDVLMAGDIVKDFAIRLQACALGQASAAILARRAIGASIEDLNGARDALYEMLKTGKPYNESAPNDRFSQLALLSDVHQYPARHASTMLAFDAVVDAANQNRLAQDSKVL